MTYKMDQFVVADKVAIITGGASGIGLQCAVKLLENGAKGITVADIPSDNSRKAVKLLQDKFDEKKVIFVETDVTVYDDFDRAFKVTVETFGQVDILINSAGILNDQKWQKEVDINIKGVIQGMLLGLENYIPKYKSGSEGVIINLSSSAGINASDIFPVYSASKFAIHGLTLAWGSSNHFERTKVRVVGVCPGVTTTPIMDALKGKTLSPAYDAMLMNIEKSAKQSPEQVADYLMTVIEKAPNGTMWVIEGGEAPYQYKMISRHDVEKHVL